ncbi:hypothetical protein [Bacillus sp. OK048]|uniref:hypothetical protein n=1 Tax=Bacillus sp. OK048 TaxID=1882761 RepID=UPI0008849F92|nr:hypothetical protein [Bacillus sp. OK048]SDM99960.1 hypothetical protein SAMN05443253_107104 [Bacillus sp. OK048]
MTNDSNSANNTVEANNKINEQLEDGKVHAPIQANSEAERANLELQNQFNQEEQQNLRISPAAISTPQ